MSSDIEEWPPPNDAVAFESLCLDLWRDIWSDPSAQKNGRSGQAQAGVDVFSQRPGLLGGLQCKQKDGLLWKKVTEPELKDEVEAACSFQPALKTFILATTGRRDARLQNCARFLSEEHQSKGLFTVEVWAWEDIWHELYQREELLKRIGPIYWPALHRPGTGKTAKIILAGVFFMTVLIVLLNLPSRQYGELLDAIETRARYSGHTVSPEEMMAYREVVARVFGDLNSNAVIRLRDRISSKTNDLSHIFDITIRSVQAGQEILTIVNVYPTGPPIDEQRVRSFAEMLGDVGAAKGVMVCNAGFTQTAKSLAPSLGVGLFSVQDAQSTNWRDDINIPVLRLGRELMIYFKPRFILEPNGIINGDIYAWRISRDGGQTSFTPMSYFTNLWNKKLILPPEDGPQELNLDGEQWRLWVDVSTGGGRWTPMSEVRFSYEYRETGAWVKYFPPVEYLAIRDQLSDKIRVTRLAARIGPLEPDNSWIPIADPNDFQTRAKGVLIVLKPVFDTLGKMKSKGGQFRAFKVEDDGSQNTTNEGKAQ